ncbi:Cytochrome P450 71B7 [Nymphaea thermarum]|nr:Cytochrome P450 71B7 [Nymphaea thermarum]
MAPSSFLPDRNQLGSALAISIVAVILPLFLSYVLLRRRWNQEISTRRLPPGPWRLPIIGNLHQLGAVPHRSFHRLSQKHGPFIFLKLGQLPTCVVSSAKLAREIMKTHDATFANRPELAAAKVLSYGCQDVGFQSYTEAWRRLRKIFVAHFTGPKRARSFKSVREEEVGLVVDAISRSAGAPVNLSHLVHALINNITCMMGFGKKYNEGGYGPQKGRLHDILETTRHLIGGFSLGDFFPSIKWVDWLTGLEFRLRRNFQELDHIFDEVLRNHVDPSRQSHEQDFVDSLLEAQKDESEDVPVTTNSVKALLLDVLLGGTDTSTSTIVWAMTELMRNPQVMKRVQDELRLKMKGKDKVEENDLDQLEYLKLVVKEIFRVHPPGPLLIPHISSKECIVDGYVIPAKTTIIINAWTIGRDPNSWKNPEEFQPERFINNPIDYMGHDFEYIPFGSGRRICTGIHLRVIVVELVLANLLYSFNWNLPGGLTAKDIDMSESPGLTVHKRAREIMKTHDATFANRPEFAAVNVLSYGRQDVGFQSYTEAWRLSKKLSVGHFTGPKRTHSFKSVREEELGLLVDHLLVRWRPC